MKTVSIVIPVYNERSTIGEVLKNVSRVKLPGWKKEIIVIDDGSTDGTGEALAAWKTKARIVTLSQNCGKGAALSEGFKYCHGDIVLIQDADLEYSPQDYVKLLSPFDNEKVFVVYGSRFLGPHLSTMFVYALGNKFVTLVTNILYNTNITDMETGYKAFRKSLVSDMMPINAKRFDFEPEVTAKVLRLGYQIYEVPISYYGRKFSEGKKLTWRDGVIAAWTLLKYRFQDIRKNSEPAQVRS